jgi:hypothetical protein
VPDATRTYYQILGIDERATSEEIATARRSMLKVVHPDLAADEADRLEREQLSRTVNDICDTLLDPVARYDYDRRLARARRWPDGIPDAESDAGSGAGADPGADDDDWPDHGEWRTTPAEDDDIAGPHPLVQRMPALTRIERWLTWPVAGLALVMLGVSTYLYDTAGARLLGELGLHFGRFGSLAVVVAWTILLVAVCLGLVHVIGVLRDRFRSR